MSALGQQKEPNVRSGAGSSWRRRKGKSGVHIYWAPAGSSMSSLFQGQVFLASFYRNWGLGGRVIPSAHTRPCGFRRLPALHATPTHWCPRVNFLGLPMLLRFKLNKSTAMFSRFRCCKISLAFNVVGCLSVFLCLAWGLNKSYKQHQRPNQERKCGQPTL